MSNQENVSDSLVLTPIETAKLLRIGRGMLKRGVPYDPNWEENGRIALARR